MDCAPQHKKSSITNLITHNEERTHPMKLTQTHRAPRYLKRVALTKPTAVLGTLAAAIAACYAPHTFAQSGARQMDEVIVTARRKDEMAQEVPISMTVMTEDFLKENNVGKIEDIGTKVPSLRISSLGGSRNEPVITLRGQRQGEAAFNQDPAAPLYFNEIVMAPIQGSNSGIYDLESLQVLKGPQGTLFGRNSTGGAIMMTPKRPGYKLGGYAEVKVGNYDLYGFEGAVDVPIVEGLTTRLAAHKLDRDGYQKNIANNVLNGKRYNDEHSEGARLSVNFEAGAFNNLTVLSYDEDKVAAGVPIASAANTSVGFLRFAPANALLQNWVAGINEQVGRDDPWKIKTDIDGEEVIRNKFFSNTTEYEIVDDLSVKNVFGYRKVHFGYASDIDGTAAPVFGAYPSGGNAGTTDPIQSPKIDTEFYSNELQLFGTSFDSKFDWITGLYWSKLTGAETKLNQQTPAFNVVIPPVTVIPQAASFENAHNSIENVSYGLFAEGTYQFVDELSLTIGARQSLEEREMSVRKYSTITPTTASCQIIAEGTTTTPAPGCSRTVDEDFDSTTWKASLNYTPTPTLLVYGSVSTGFRAGGFNTRGTNDATLQPFDPENVTTYEVGTKQDWDIAGMPLRSNLAVFMQEYEDIQQTLSFAGSTGALETKTINAAKAEITGLELDVTFQPIDDLMLSASYSYVNAKYKDKADDIDFNGDRVLAGAELGVDTSSNAFAYIPEQSATASVTYTLPLPAEVGDISFMASAYWQDKMRSHPLYKQFDQYTWSAANKAIAKDVSEIDSYAVLNLRADWRGIMGSSFDAAIYVDNLEDEQYVQGGLNIIESLGYTAYNYGAPRTYGASVRYSF